MAAMLPMPPAGFAPTGSSRSAGVASATATSVTGASRDDSAPAGSPSKTA